LTSKNFNLMDKSLLMNFALPLVSTNVSRTGVFNKERRGVPFQLHHRHRFGRAKEEN
jgi:hypothetical protein